VQARAVQQHARRESMAFVPGEAFYADGGGTQELRVCHTAQPARARDRCREVPGEGD